MINNFDVMMFYVFYIVEEELYYVNVCCSFEKMNKETEIIRNMLFFYYTLLRIYRYFIYIFGVS